MLDRLSSCSASFPKCRTNIKVESAQLPVRFVVGLHFQAQCIIISEKMDGVSQNYFCKTAIYTRNFHYKERGEKWDSVGGRRTGSPYFWRIKKYSRWLVRIHLWDFRLTMLVFMKYILSKENRPASAGKPQMKQMAKMQSMGSKLFQLKLILSVPHSEYLSFPAVDKPSNLKLGHYLHPNELLCQDEPAQLQ